MAKNKQHKNSDTQVPHLGTSNPEAKRLIVLVSGDAAKLTKNEQLLKDAGYSCLSTPSGNQALKMLLEYQPVLAVIDDELQDLTGVEVFETLVSASAYQNVAQTPIVLIASAEVAPRRREHLLDLGLAALLTEPLAEPELLKAIDQVLQLRPASARMQTSTHIPNTNFKYQDLIENVNDLIFAIDLDGNFIFVNHKLESVTGKTQDDWLGKKFIDMVIEEDRKNVAGEVACALQAETRTFEMKVASQNQVVYYSTNLNPIYESNRLIGAVGISRDIDERKKLEQKIIELKNFNESIIRSMQSGLITLNLNEEIVFFNATAEDILQFKAHEVQGRKIKEILPAEEVDRLLMETASVAVAPSNREMMLTQRDGKKVHIGFTVTPQLDDAGSRMGTIISFKNITEIKMMQLELIRMDRLASLGVLASGIAHELRNPLAGIKTMAQSLEEDFEAEDPRQEYLKRIIRQVNRLDDLLKTFFSYARPRQPIRKSHRLPDIVHEVQALIESKLTKKRIRLVEEYEENLPAIFVDYDQIQQVFLNLILNAIDAIDHDGTLTMTAISLITRPHAIDRRRSDYAQRAQPKLYVEARVTDSGCGIEPENLKRIFDPFFTTKPTGTGLGLSVVYRIMTEHGGEIRAESTFGKGTTFILLLPTEE